MSETFSPSAVEAELNRLREKPLSKFIDGLLAAVEERISNISLSDSAERWPCRLCHGAGFLIISGDLYAVKGGALEPVRRANGGAIRIPDPIECPRCLGTQFDLQDMFNSWMQVRQQVTSHEVAA